VQKSIYKFAVSIVVIVCQYSPLFGQEFEVDTLKFFGAHHIDTENLVEIIHSEEGDDFDPRLVKLDKILLTNYYRTQGFLTAQVFDSLVIRRSAQKVDIFYTIAEGQKYKTGEFRITGNQIFTKEQLMASFSNSPTGEPFDESKIDNARMSLENNYYNIGKPFVEMDLDYEFYQDSLVMIKLDISEGPTVFIRDIKYSGLAEVQEFIIRRELEFKKGDQYSREKFTVSQQNIYKTGLFDLVNFAIEPLPDDSTQVTLLIAVQEKDSRWVGARVGFAYEQELSYGNKLELSLEGGHRNLYGTARSVSLHIIPSLQYDFQKGQLINPDNQISFFYVEPWIGYTRTPGVVNLAYHQYRPINSANFDIYQASFNVSHEYNHNFRASGTIQAKIVDQLTDEEVDTTIITDVGQDLVYSISLYGVRNTKNNFFNPGDGALTDISIAFSHSIGKNSEGERDAKQYITLVSSWQRYQPIGFRVSKKVAGAIVATRIRGGAIVEFGDTRAIPISDLFFAGGATTVRGYQEQLLGPTLFDENGYKTTALGGKLLYLMNAEVRLPLFWLFVGEVFLDAGNVWSEIEQFSFGDIKFGTGAGLVILTPVGPIRFEYGWKLTPESSDRTLGTFHLGFYYAF
jgi:outer membrane protein insertion porin family